MPGQLKSMPSINSVSMNCSLNGMSAIDESKQVNEMDTGTADQPTGLTTSDIIDCESSASSASSDLFPPELVKKSQTQSNDEDLGTIAGFMPLTPSVQTKRRREDSESTSSEGSSLDSQTSSEHEDEWEGEEDKPPLVLPSPVPMEETSNNSQQASINNESEEPSRHSNEEKTPTNNEFEPGTTPVHHENSSNADDMSNSEPEKLVDTKNELLPARDTNSVTNSEHENTTPSSESNSESDKLVAGVCETKNEDDTTEASIITESERPSEKDKTSEPVEESQNSLEVTNKKSTFTATESENNGTVKPEREVVPTLENDCLNAVRDHEKETTENKENNGIGEDSEVKTSTSVQSTEAVRPKTPGDYKLTFTVKNKSQNEKLEQQENKDGVANLRPTSKFLYMIGLSLLRESVYEGLSAHVDSSMKTGSSKYNKKQYESLQDSLSTLKTDNKLLKMKMNKVCTFEIDGRRCGFRTESQLALETHLSESHNDRYDRFYCARCGFWCPRSSQPKVFKNHMLYSHGCQAIPIRARSFHYCKLCYYETNSQDKMRSHSAVCEKSFKLDKNLAPDYYSMTPYNEDLYKTPSASNPSLRQMVMAPLPPSKTLPPGMQMVVGPRPAPSKQPITGQLRFQSPSNMKPTTPIIVQPRQKAPPMMSISSTQKTIKQSDLISCEICEGLIQGAQALKVHMQWCHNISIAQFKEPIIRCPVSFYCTQTFWTVEGMSKHSKTCVMLTRPGSVKVLLPNGKISTGSNRSKCFLCQSVVPAPVIEHVMKSHLNDLKLMVEGRRCAAGTCISLKIHNVEQLQNHLNTIHQLNVTGLSAFVGASMASVKYQPFCSVCKMKFSTSQDFSKHCALRHVFYCKYCGVQCSTRTSLTEHEYRRHPRFCLACTCNLTPKNYYRHVITKHIRKVSIPVKRLSQTEYEQYSKKPKITDSDWAVSSDERTDDESTDTDVDIE